MTGAEIIAHWRKRAAESLRVAERTHEDGYFAHALFNCHLAVEKALKARFMEEHQAEPPPTHDLFFVAKKLKQPWTENEKEQLGYLTQYAVASRYDDPHWAQHEATQENSARWIAVARVFLSILQP
ncbi:hypothetical protein A3A67_02390 [Candidatus Peribacteria bacterium RIFCSPLOWO2_01_FULL_51_18]|nr:MAG: hypothetical protein A3C52_04790 [Candidatus Peribacteria bacterium RIFCSPHIGHO2_02_FULL_51_15]OGJ66862.1 MAG: hypothetical protein A3A67_02390 [Candidatus Peribacteria bacterium RIFCSPLOWO2_01_FULL_51_18]OGJ69664.1 MAG: hypothetical protein A3J34_02790 [Candidatus Peribacteria bacterium RIFCSPLOWO2_02_FULL_51_10]